MKNNSASQSRLLAAIPVLPASDVSLALAHYVQNLGFQEEFSHGEPPEYAGISRDGIRLHLSRTEDAKSVAAQTMLRFEVQNIAALYEEIQAQSEIHPNGALHATPWSTREFTVVDRDGVCISFFETNKITS